MNKQSTWKKNLHKRKGQKGKDKSAELMKLSPEQRKERYKKEKLDKIESKEKQSLESKAYAYTSSFKTKVSSASLIKSLPNATSSTFKGSSPFGLLKPFTHTPFLKSKTSSIS